MNGQEASSRWLVILAACLLIPGLCTAQISSEADSDIERCLLEGKVLKLKEKLVGVTRPVRFELECGDQKRSAVFKSLDEHRRGVSRFQRGGAELDFSDSYKYERAAYLLDRELGMNMVPVAVLRKLKGDDGTLVDWIEKALHEKDLKQRPKGAQVALLARQKATMRLFDALILNVDRRPENWMVNDQDWKLYLIDHSRSFRNRKELPEEFVGSRARLSRETFEGLQALDESRLTELLDGLITQAQIRSVLKRRDLILEKVEKDRQEYGDELVFFAS